MMSKDRLEACGIVPVVVLDRVEDAVPLAQALLKGGIDVMEITFRTEAAKASIEEIARQVPEVYVGAGTVLTVDQVDQALEAGAQFIVSPGYDAEMVRYCQEKNVPVFPGALTPSEIMQALQQDIQTVKVFPANAFGGLQMIKALAGPFPSMHFMPTGGVNQENLKEYLLNPKIHAVGGSWICTKSLIEAGDWEEITKRARESRETFLSVRPA